MIVKWISSPGGAGPSGSHRRGVRHQVRTKHEDGGDQGRASAHRGFRDGTARSGRRLCGSGSGGWRVPARTPPALAPWHPPRPGPVHAADQRLAAIGNTASSSNRPWACRRADTATAPRAWDDTPRVIGTGFPRASLDHAATAGRPSTPAVQSSNARAAARQPTTASSPPPTEFWTRPCRASAATM